MGRVTVRDEKATLHKIAVGLTHVLGGAWMGGTIDATGAVAAAGAFLSDRTLYVAATIKMIQNVLIGVIAFCVAVYWVTRVKAVPGQQVGAMEIWYRFPKFVLGFIVASILFSIMYEAMGNDIGYALIDRWMPAGFRRRNRAASPHSSVVVRSPARLLALR